MPLNRVQFDSNNNVNVVGGLTAPNLVARQGTTGPIDLSSSSSVLGTGMDLITPTGVAGDGLLSLSGGNVSFQGSRSVSINGCFNSTYDNYKIVLNQNISEGNENLFMRFRSAGITNSSATYSHAILIVSSSVTGGNSTLGSSGIIGKITSPLYAGANATIDVCSPFINQMTTYTSATGSAAFATGQIEMYYIYGTQLSRTSFDGFTIFSSSSWLLTGSLRIYGYRNQ
jgi:hypothetical protein